MAGRVINFEKYMESIKLNNINTEHIDDEFIKIKVIDKYIPQNDCVFKIYIKDNQVKVEKVEENCDIELDINSITQLAFSYLDINEIFMLNEIDESCLTYNKRKLLNILFEKKVNYIDELV